MDKLRARLTRAPLPCDAAPDVGAPPEARALVAGLGHAPYLAALIRREAGFAETLWDRAPEAALEDLLREAAMIEGDPSVPLRTLKRRLHLLVALADLGGAWTTMEACAALTRFADAALAAALGRATAQQVAKGRLPEGDPGPAAIAMGKMGAGELNYSSDIDLILVFDQTRHDPNDYATVRAAHVAAARAIVATLSRVTAEGYVHRTDLRLRPDPSSTPLVLAMETAERYYEALGRTWERAAHVKARAAAGDVAGGAAYLDRLSPFVWRRHLDFAAVEDAHAMRLAIRDAHAPVDRGLPGRDVKLGRGGIREIEFFAQTHQIIAGGRDPALRVRPTLEALDRLEAAGHVAAGDAETLRRAYPLLRDVEHRLQMVQDAQTHRVPEGAEGRARIGALMGDPDWEGPVAAAMEAVAAVVDPFFVPAAPVHAVPALPNAAVAERWPTYPALRSERAARAFERLRPAILSRLAAAPRPEAALAAFDGFLARLPAGAQLFALFEANPSLLDLVADVASASAPLARQLAADARVLDAVLDGSFFDPLPDVETWTREARAALADGFEASLDGLRRWHREARFRVGVHLLRGLATPEEAGEAHARLAEAAVIAAWDAARAETARRRGPGAGLRMAVLGMGSLGAGAMTAASDLDLVVLHDDGMAGAPAWAATATRTLVTALSAPTGEGVLYPVDLRLRPSGRQGPVATSLAAFARYQRTEAWAWEWLALTRARAVAGQARDAGEAARRAVVREMGAADPARVRREAAEMRARLRAAGAVAGDLRDIELAASVHALGNGDPAQAAAAQLDAPGWLGAEDRAALARAHARLSAIAQLAKLAAPEDDAAGLRFAADRLGTTEAALGLERDDLRAEAASRIDAALVADALDGPSRGG